MQWEFIAKRSPGRSAHGQGRDGIRKRACKSSGIAPAGECPVVPVSPFQARVFKAVAGIPRGRVSTYKLVAESLGCAAPRAVGQALKVNPFAPRVPCHRVIASNLRIGGFQGAMAGPAVRRKLHLLAAEGVQFSDGRLTDPGRVFDFRDAPVRRAKESDDARRS